MQTPDVVNGTFEIVGGLLCWLNVHKIAKEKYFAGIHWPVQAFFSVWGLWNLFYYPMLGQWVSFVGGLFLFVGNTAWVAFAVYYSKGTAMTPEDRFKENVVVICILCMVIIVVICAMQEFFF